MTLGFTKVQERAEGRRRGAGARRRRQFAESHSGPRGLGEAGDAALHLLSPSLTPRGGRRGRDPQFGPPWAPAPAPARAERLPRPDPAERCRAHAQPREPGAHEAAARRRG